MEDRAESRGDHLFLLASGLTILLGAALAVTRLHAESLWLDETYTWWFSGMDWRGLLEAVRLDAVNPPFYYLYVNFLAPGTGEASLRLPSVVAHVAGIAAAILLGRRLGGRIGGIAAGIVWAAHPLTLWAARDARPYALAAALGVVATFAYFRARDRGSRREFVAAGLSLALGLLTHYFFFVFAAALLVLAVLDLRRSPEFFRRWSITSLAAMVPLLAWLAFYFSQGTPSLGIGWIRTPTLSDLPLTLWNLASGYAGVFDRVSSAFGIGLVALASLAVARGDRRLSGSLLAVGILLPVAAVWTISQRRPVYVDRYFIVLMPFVVGLVAHGASQVSRIAPEGWKRPRGFRILLGTAVVLAAAPSAFSVHTEAKFTKEDWRGLVAFLQGEGATIESTFLSEPEISLPLDYYGYADLESDLPALVPACGSSCWWIVRQPYTATHALTQSVVEAGRGDLPAVLEGCSNAGSWESPTGVAVWHPICGRP